MDEIQALFEVWKAHLRGASPLWGQQVYPNGMAPADAVRPYVLMFWAGGGYVPVTQNRRTVRLTISVKGVADEMAAALAMKAALGDLLMDSGVYDTNPSLPAHADWLIKTVTQDRIIYLEEAFQGAQWIYHAGNQYVVEMERV